MCKMKENQSSVEVLRIQPKVWWMLPMGVRDNNTKYEPTVASGNGRRKYRTSISKSAVYGQNAPFFPRTAVEPAENDQIKGNSGYSTCSKLCFEPRGPRYGLFLVWGCHRARCTISRAFKCLLGAVRGHVVEVEGPRRPFTSKATIPGSWLCKRHVPLAKLLPYMNKRIDIISSNQMNAPCMAPTHTKQLLLHT